jgi:glucose/arabinose dehydrogenase
MPIEITSLRAAAITLATLMLGCRATEQPRDRDQVRQTSNHDKDGNPRDQLAAEALPQRLAEATPQDPLRPEPPKGPTVYNEPDPPSDEPPKLAGLKLPPGFAIELYTAEVPHARSLALGPAGVVFVGTRDDDRVYAVIDKDGDHRVDEVRTIARDLDRPNGVAYEDGDLYVAPIDRIIRFPNIADRLDNPPEPELVSDALPNLRAHGWRYIRFGPDGLLYVPIGAPCNNCLRDDPMFASISRMRPDGTGFEIYASGVRNSVGLDWHPETKELWFTENGRDELGNDIPPDELNRATKPGMHFGFPYCHGGVILDPEFGEGRSCAEFTPPEQNLGPHVAPLGMRFYTGAMFPARYRNSVIVAEHGSWNREEKIGYRVMLVPIENGEAAGYEPLVEGFLDPQSGEVRGRPVDVAVLDDGSLLISDDYKGAIYRLSYAS